MSKFVLNEPKGQHVLEIYAELSYIRIASYTPHTPPYLNIKTYCCKSNLERSTSPGCFDLV
jgi:hypothetical protein